MAIQVRFLDLKAQYDSMKEEIDAGIRDVINSSAFAGGPFVERFEEEWAEYCGTRYSVGVGSGTDALWLGLLALGVGEGDEVITVPNTFVATVEAILRTGATPVFVDMDKVHYTMDPRLLENAITSNTRVILPVHMFGQMADMDPIMETARSHGLRVLEDACQAHGATYQGKRAGSVGDAAAFSFYPGKNLGAYGEAGAVTTNNEEIAKKIKMLRNHGQTKKYYHELVGWNSRMDGIQAAVLSAKLRHLDDWNEARRRHASEYGVLLDGLGALQVPGERNSCRHVYHLYVISSENRDGIAGYLRDNAVETGIHYPISVTKQKAYCAFAEQGTRTPIATDSAALMLSLPMYAELSTAQIERVVHLIRKGLSH